MWETSDKNSQREFVARTCYKNLRQQIAAHLPFLRMSQLDISLCVLHKGHWRYKGCVVGLCLLFSTTLGVAVGAPLRVSSWLAKCVFTILGSSSVWAHTDRQLSQGIFRVHLSLLGWTFKIPWSSWAMTCSLYGMLMLKIAL